MQETTDAVSFPVSCHFLGRQRTEGRQGRCWPVRFTGSFCECLPLCVCVCVGDRCVPVYSHTLYVCVWDVWCLCERETLYLSCLCISGSVCVCGSCLKTALWDSCVHLYVCVSVCICMCV